MMVGVDALIASWCKIFKPESHLVASSFESASEVNGNRMLCYALGRLLLGDLLTLAPASPAPYRWWGWEKPVPICSCAAGHQKGISFIPSRF